MARHQMSMQSPILRTTYTSLNIGPVNDHSVSSRPTDGILIAIADLCLEVKSVF